MSKNHYIEADPKQRLEKSSKCFKTTSDDKVLATGLRSIAQEEIKQLFRKDLKTNLPTLQLHKSRDVSHLKDLNSPRSIQALVNLPTDMQSLRLLISSKSQKNLENHKICKKKNCIERMISLSPELESFELNEFGVPTSRKEAENLLKWFRLMKSKHGFSDEFDIVVMISGQEILKQVKGQCKHLGYVLKDIFKYYRNSTDKAKKQYEQENELIRLSNEAKIKKLEAKFKEELDKQENKVKELQNLIEKNKVVLKNAQDDCKFYKIKLNEVQRLYLTEQDIWRKRSIELLKENVKNSITITHESYKLAIARWRKDLFHSEIENQPTVCLPEVIRDKLENEQPLSPEELSIYRELYYIAEEEKNKKRFFDVETQTEHQEIKVVEEGENLDDSLVKLTKHVENTEKMLEAVYDSKPGTEDKDIQVELDLELGVDDEILKELEKFLTIDENFEAILNEKNEIDQSLNTSEESEENEKSVDEDKVEENTEKVGDEDQEIEIEPEIKDVKIKNYENNSEEIEKGKTSLRKQRSLKKVNSKQKIRTKRSLTGLKPRNQEPQLKDSRNLPRKNSNISRKRSMKAQDSSVKPEKISIKSEEFPIVNKNLQYSPQELTNLHSNPLTHKTSEQVSSVKEKIVSQASLASSKQEIDLSQEPLKNSSFLLKRRQTELIQNLISGKLGPTLQKSAQSLTRTIQEKIKELDSLNTQVIQKRKLLISLTTHINHHFSNNEKLHKRVNSAQLDNKPIKSPSLNTLNDSFSSINKNESKFFPDIEIIDEVNEEFENIKTPFGLDEDTWKTGFAVGFNEGTIVGFNKGKEFASEELYIEGYAQATRELQQDEEIDPDDNKNIPEVTSPINKVFKKSKMLEVKSQKELTKFFEFNFTNKKITPRRSGTLVFESVTLLLKKLPEFLKRKSKLSRKMLNKMMAGFYEAAYSQLSSEGAKDMLLLCYDEIGHKYGLKKVSDRKFIEFISELIKNKEFKRCSMFLKLINMNQVFEGEFYSKPTIVLYLESYKYMISSKIGIVTNYDESDDKILLPANRAIECIKEQLEGKVEKNLILNLVNSIEHKSTPDPRRINTGLVELEYVLETICDCYESFQQKIKNSTKKVFSSFMQSDLVPNYVFHIVMRTAAGSKYSKIEEMGIKQDLSLDEINELCIGLNIFAENDFNYLVKGSFLQRSEKYEELLQILKAMEEKDDKWISFSCDEWKVLLDSCRNSGEDDETAALLWVVYETELRRIYSEI